MSKFTLSRLDRLLISIAPGWGMRRVQALAQAEMLERSYDAAGGGRRTAGWHRTSTDANSAAIGSLATLRDLSRDLRRNNGWARRGVQVIANNVVGWGIMPKPSGRSRARSRKAIAIWNKWASSTECDFDGLLNFYGLQRLVMTTVVESGEALVVKQPGGDHSIPMRLQVLEPDYLDTSKHGVESKAGGPTVGGVEFDRLGRRVAYWLFTSHPGSRGLMTTRFDSVRVPAERVLHVYDVDRPGQVRGVPWLAAAIARLNDLDDFEDAELMQQKVAACFGAFVTETDASGAVQIGKPDPVNENLEQLEPGHIAYLPPGKTVQFATPPRAQDGAFSTRTLRRIAVSLGVPYEEMSGDYSQVNFSSARMARLAHWQNVHVWREHMLIPRLCASVWRWAMECAAEMEQWPGTALPTAEWSAPPMPVLEPDREGIAYQRLIRNGLMTLPQVLREQGYDPYEQIDEIEAFNKELDARGIVLDSDARKTTAGGQQQSVQGASSTDDVDDADEGDEDSDDATAPEEPAEKPAAAAKESPANEGDEAKPAEKQTASAPTEVKVFAYHQPFMTVKEIREGVGLSGDITDSELFANEFVAKHSGASGDGDSDGGDTDDGPGETRGALGIVRRKSDGAHAEILAMNADGTMVVRYWAAGSIGAPPGARLIAKVAVDDMETLDVAPMP